MKCGSIAFRQLGSWTVLAIAGTMFLFSAVAILWPAVDQFPSMMFYAGAGVFPARGVPALRVLFFLGNATTYIVIAGLIAFPLAKFLSHRWVEAISWRVWWFLTAALALGPGLIVNGLIKPLINRPRPMQTDLFGGSQHFVSAWSIGNEGVGNRSFPSGEAAAAMYLVAFAFVVPKTHRRGVAIVALFWALCVGFNRIAFGAHYLSDVLVSWGLTLIVLLQLRVLLLPSADSRTALDGTASPSGRPLQARPF